MAARIVTVADFYDALTHARPYRPQRMPETVLPMIVAGRATHFDPAVVDAFLHVHNGG
ncbi:MAG: HD-GYP domain-containing protein [Gemmatimonadota bacterium]